MFSFLSARQEQSAESYRAKSQAFIAYLERAEDFIGKHPRLSKSIIKAKEQFSLKAGKLNYAEESYLQRIKAFLYWFLFNWPKNDSYQEKPIEAFIRSLEGKDERDYGKQLLDHSHALFLLKGRSKAGFGVENLFTKQKLTVAAQDSFAGIDYGNWFETRIFKVEGSYLLADYLILHPPVVLKMVKKQIKLGPKNYAAQQELMFKLQDCYFKWKNYRQIDINAIYNLKLNRVD